MDDKQYLSAQELLNDSFELGLRIYKSGFRPSFIIAIWRGGTPVGIAVQEILDHLGVKTDHIAIRTSSYYGIDKRDKEVRVHGLEYVVRNANWEDGLLIVDDVFDSGSSIKAVIEALKNKMRRNLPDDIRIATPWFKPKKNVTGIIPDYFIHETDQWLIFPHELDGLTREEIFANKPGMRTRLFPFLPTIIFCRNLRFSQFTNNFY
jgi:hypoxanthine phosphoribosyltransferase